MTKALAGSAPGARPVKTASSSAILSPADEVDDRIDIAGAERGGERRTCPHRQGPARCRCRPAVEDVGAGIADSTWPARCRSGRSPRCRHGVGRHQLDLGAGLERVAGAWPRHGQSRRPPLRDAVVGSRRNRCRCRQARRAGRRRQPPSRYVVAGIADQHLAELVAGQGRSPPCRHGSRWSENLDLAPAASV